MKDKNARLYGLSVLSDLNDLEVFSLSAVHVDHHWLIITGEKVCEIAIAPASRTKAGDRLPLLNQAAARFADGGCGFQDRIAVSVAGGARNFLRRNKRLASLRKQGPDSLRSGLLLRLARYDCAS